MRLASRKKLGCKSPANSKVQKINSVMIFKRRIASKNRLSGSMLSIEDNSKSNKPVTRASSMFGQQICAQNLDIKMKQFHFYVNFVAFLSHFGVVCSFTVGIYFSHNSIQLPYISQYFIFIYSIKRVERKNSGAIKISLLGVIGGDF